MGLFFESSLILLSIVLLVLDLGNPCWLSGAIGCDEGFPIA